MRVDARQAIADPCAAERGSRLERKAEQRIGPAVLEFCRLRLFDSFHMDELARFVRARTGCAAPDSAGRILRLLRRRRMVDYQVTSRAKSLYTITRVDEQAQY